MPDDPIDCRHWISNGGNGCSCRAEDAKLARLENDNARLLAALETIYDHGASGAERGMQYLGNLARAAIEEANR